MQITVYSGFSKRVNSTKQPLSGTTKTVVLKEETDIIHPTFILNTLDFTINYVQAFGNYYFARVKNLDNTRCEIICDLDHMATYKTEVGSYTGFIEYTSASSDIMITDPRNQPTCNIANSHVSQSFAWNTSTTGCYIIGVAAKGGVKQGSTTFYALSKTGFADICNKIYDSSLWTQMWNQFNGVQNAILTSFWVPFDLTWVATNFTANLTSLFEIGDESVVASDCYNIINRIHTESTITITASYPYSFGGVNTPCYVYKAPYCTVTLYLPFVGTVELSADIALDNPAFNITAQMDILTGDIIYYVEGAEAGLIATYSGNFASKIPVSGATYDAIGVIKGAATAVIGGVSTILGNPMAGAGAALAGVNQTVNSMRLTSQNNGNISSALGGLYYSMAKLDVHIALPAEPSLTAYQAEQGMPYFKTATVSSLSGFIKCSNASVSIPGDGAEQETVNGYMNSGFYYE